MANIITSRILPARIICAQSSSFNAGSLNAAKCQTQVSGGEALVVVHPLFSQHLYQNDFQERYNPLLFRQMAQKDYTEYQGNLEKCLTSTDKLTFVLAEERAFDNILNWLVSLNIDRDTFILKTIEKNPTPVFDFSSVTPAWQIFADMLKAAGVTRVSLAGELAFIDRAKAKGCVYIAENSLSPFFRVEVIHSLTFPGVEG